MKNLLGILLLMIVVHTKAQQPYWQQQADHVIDVKLNPSEKTLDGFERITYTNNSPDTLHFIWFHVWPNAYKNDQTAFSSQQLENGNTDFYFADKEQRGYINRMDFRVNGVAARTEDHPEHIDIIKLLLTAPLAPGQTTVITTPFHVKLPFNFSRGGFDGNAFQLTQWYPKPAVYDSKGWHPMPYLDQGEFYNEFGNYLVTITVPENFVVAATGVLQEESEKQWLLSRAHYQKAPVQKPTGKYAKKPVLPAKAETIKYKTISYRQEKVHDFAWFASPEFMVAQDTCVLPTGRVIGVAAYYTNEVSVIWKQATGFAKDAVRFYSEELGEYPYDVVTVVQGPQSFGGGMEYPTITVIAPVTRAKELDVVVAHEVGHNWFQGMLASNERNHPWLDEGINSFYEKKYTERKYGPQSQEEKLLLQTQVHAQKDQPITTASTIFSETNYGAVAYYKTAQWLQYLEARSGPAAFKAAMQQYFREWQFKHPQPEDFKNSISHLPGAAEAFALLEKKGMLPGQELKGTNLVSPFIDDSFKKFINQPAKNNLLLSPALGFNQYDRLMIGVLFTNYLLPPSKLQFLLVPLYALGSKELNATGTLGYHFYQNGHKFSLGVSGFHFSKDKAKDSTGKMMFERFSKLTPSARFTWAQSPRSSKEQWFELRSYFINEKEFSAFTTASDGLLYADSMRTQRRKLNQLSFGFANHRALYPFGYNLQLQQGDGFYRLNFTGDYFFNYAKGGGTSLRLFGAAFGYSTNNLAKRFATFLYQPKLLGVTGEEDYTYSNYFIGRSASYTKDQSVVENAGLAAQQIMIRDGGMKLRLDYFDFLQGRSERWVTAMNLNTTLPKNLLPLRLPLRLFLDIGTYAGAWEKEAEGSRLLYVGGLQFSIAKVINIYAPIFYSKVFRDNLKALSEQNSFLRKITFSIDIQTISLRRLTNNQLSL